MSGGVSAVIRNSSRSKICPELVSGNTLEVLNDCSRESRKTGNYSCLAWRQDKERKHYNS